MCTDTWGLCTLKWRCVYMSLAQIYTDAFTCLAYVYRYIDECTHCTYPMHTHVCTYPMHKEVHTDRPHVHIHI